MFAWPVLLLGRRLARRHRPARLRPPRRARRRRHRRTAGLPRRRQPPPAALFAVTPIVLDTGTDELRGRDRGGLRARGAALARALRATGGRCARLSSRASRPASCSASRAPASSGRPLLVAIALALRRPRGAARQLARRRARGRRRLPRGALALGSYWYARNWIDTGNPSTRSRSRLAGITVFDGPFAVGRRAHAPGRGRGRRLAHRRASLAGRPTSTSGTRASYDYQQRLGGLGPLWPWLALPLLVPLAIALARRRARAVLAARGDRRPLPRPALPLVGPLHDPARRAGRARDRRRRGLVAVARGCARGAGGCARRSRRRASCSPRSSRPGGAGAPRCRRRDVLGLDRRAGVRAHGGPALLPGVPLPRRHAGGRARRRRPPRARRALRLSRCSAPSTRRDVRAGSRHAPPRGRLGRDRPRARPLDRALAGDDRFSLAFARRAACASGDRVAMTPRTACRAQRPAAATAAAGSRRAARPSSRAAARRSPAQAWASARSACDACRRRAARARCRAARDGARSSGRATSRPPRARGHVGGLRSASARGAGSA